MKVLCLPWYVDFLEVVDFHTLRHTWISWPLAILLRSGGDGATNMGVSMRYFLLH